MAMVKSFLTFILLLFSISAGAQDDMSPLWEKVGRWDIRVDTSLGSGCFAIVIDDERVFRFGIDNTSSTVYGVVGRTGWDSIEKAREYPIDIEFDSEGAWDTPATGMDFDGVKGLGFEVDNGLFIDEMIAGRTMYIRYQGEQIMKLSMEGSARAAVKLVECMEAFDPKPENNQDNSDPFSSSSDDPFAPNY
jgi:hypothetical protein